MTTVAEHYGSADSAIALIIIKSIKNINYCILNEPAGRGKTQINIQKKLSIIIQTVIGWVEIVLPGMPAVYCTDTRIPGIL